MEEKERYEWNSRFDEAIKDNQTGDIVNAVEVLNKQDKRIKELEEELENYKLCRCVDCSSEYEKGLETSIDELENENHQLKQQLHDLPKKIVGEIKNNCWYGGAFLEDNYYKVTDKLLDTILKKYGGKDEINND